MKKLFLVLVVLNLAVFMWLYPQHAEQRHSAQVREPEVGNLRLLSEIKEVGALRPKAIADSAPKLAQVVQPEPALDKDLMPASQAEQAAEQPQEPQAVQETEQPAIEETEAAPEQEASPAQESEQEPEPVVDQHEERTAPVACYRLGPLEQQAQAARLLKRIKPLALESAIREEIVQKEAGYWVIHPPLETTELAQAKEREFKAAGIKDIWRIREGDMKDAISLGLFFEKNNAEKLKRQIEAKGFMPEIRLRQVEQVLYWIDLQVRAGVAPLDRIKGTLEGQQPALELKPAPCPDIVSP